MANQFVWVFNGPRGRFPGGIFSKLENAEQWIKSNQLTGILTQYPLDTGSYDWANENGLVSEKQKSQFDKSNIGSFSSASFLHYHYEDGDKV